jgi:asparagine synthase (glutamine-hydrolysing)
MFAFGLWDSVKKQLFLARDRFGIKPLYYHINNESFIFSSEIKGIIEDRNIKREIDFSSFCDFFVYRYVPSPKTIWKNTFKLPPANFMIIDAKLNVRIQQYWSLNTNNITIPEKDVIEKVDELLLNSVKQHIISDVPVGSFLSGGYDSSAMVYYMHKLKYPTHTFSIGFENWQFSEHQYAEMVAEVFNTDHISQVIGKESLENVEKLSFYFDEPLADISIVPTYIVSKLASSHVKAVLSGEGADEIFAGYTWHKSYYDNFNLRPSHDRLKSIFNSGYTPFGVNEYSEAMSMGKFDNEALVNLLNEDIQEYISKNTDWYYQKHFKPCFSPVKSMQYLDINTFMSELVLAKIDRACMSCSLEARVPFLDHEFIEYMFNLKENIYFKKDYKKFILFENIKKVLPKSILTRSKQGFVGPDSYYRQIDWYKIHLSESMLVKDDLINRDTLNDWILSKDFWRLWKVLIMEFWYRRWMK